MCHVLSEILVTKLVLLWNFKAVERRFSDIVRVVCYFVFAHLTFLCTAEGSACLCVLVRLSLMKNAWRLFGPCSRPLQETLLVAVPSHLTCLEWRAETSPSLRDLCPVRNHRLITRPRSGWWTPASSLTPQQGWVHTDRPNATLRHANSPSWGNLIALCYTSHSLLQSLAFLCHTQSHALLGLFNELGFRTLTTAQLMSS